MNELLIGIDWSQDFYDIAFLSPSGAFLNHCQINKTTAGFSQLDNKIGKFGLPTSQCLVGMETAHNILIDFLWSRRYAVYVIPPSIVNSCRGRFGNSGARTDKTDAHLIADLLRTDRARFVPWTPGSQLLVQMKTRLNAVNNLTQLITQYVNRLRAILLRVYPQALNAFRRMTTRIALHFLIAHPTPYELSELTYSQFASFCRQHHCHRTDWLTSWYAGLQQTAPIADSVLTEAYKAEIVFLARLLLMAVQEKQSAIDETQILFQQHPDHAIFVSLPGAGALLQPQLLVMFGEDRDRFPTPQGIRALAGTCPVTKQSGKKRHVQFRRACNHVYRDVAHQFAKASVTQADWAATYFSQVLARGHSRSEAYRCLANRWLGIIWKMWQTGQPYDEAYHLRQLHKHRR